MNCFVVDEMIIKHLSSFQSQLLYFISVQTFIFPHLIPGEYIWCLGCNYIIMDLLLVDICKIIL